MDILFALNPVLLGAIPVIVGLVGVVKSWGFPSQYSVLAAMVFGVAASWLIGTPMPAFITQGIILGLSASGLYSGSKKLAGIS